jgi:hypothetical protein
MIKINYLMFVLNSNFIDYPVLFIIFVAAALVLVLFNFAFG